MKKYLFNWKNTLMLGLIFFISTSAFTQTAPPPSAGEGTVGNPYQIATLDNLYWLSQTPADWDKHYIQTADIDARTSKTWDSEAGFSPIGQNSTNSFTGSYNGKGHVIDSLHINRPTSGYIGLFGYTSEAKIDSIGVINYNYKGNNAVGGIVGFFVRGVLNYSYSTGTIKSTKSSGSYSYAGGLVAFSSGNINYCYSNSNINASGHNVGGLMAQLSTPGKITNSYSGGVIDAIKGYAGGLVGNNYSTIENCYSYTSVSCTGQEGGLVSYGQAPVINSFWDKEKSGVSRSAKGTGLNTTEMKNLTTFLDAGWDFLDETFNGTDDIWGINSAENDGYPFLKWQGYSNTGVLSCQAPTSPAKNLFLEKVTINSIEIASIAKAGYGVEGYAIYINTDDIWISPSDSDKPTSDTVWQNSGQQCVYFGTSVKPEIVVSGLNSNTNYFFKIYAYSICSGVETYEQTGLLKKQYTRNNFSVPLGVGTSDNPYVIATLENLTWLTYNNKVWDKHFIQTTDINAAKSIEWEDSAGFSPIGNRTVEFTGTYHGKGYVIDSLCINRPLVSNIGLFGVTNKVAEIDSLGVTNVNITGSGRIGGLVGKNEAIIRNCFTSGNIIANSSFSGGLTGTHYDNYISNSYSKVNVNSKKSTVGGLIGSFTNAELINCYSTGNVIGTEYVGGFIGQCGYSASITNCYSVGIVLATGKKGGLVGNGSLTALNSFWDVETSGVTESMGGIGLSISEMQDIKIYLNAGWDFMDETINGSNNDWGINNAENGGYPFLKWQGFSNEAILCQAPLSPASNITFGDMQPNNITIDSVSKAGYGTEGYVMYVNNTDTWASPADGSELVVNTTWQNTGQQCIYFGISNAPEVIVTGINLCNNYYIKVYAYTICSGTKLYETTGVSSIYGAEDTEAPVPDVGNLPDIDGECLVTITDVPTANDICSGSITASTTNPLEYTEIGNYTITWTYDDGNGNTITQEQTVEVNDITAPIPDMSDLDTITADCSVRLTNIPTATDNCTALLVATTSDDLSYTKKGTYTITWIYDDSNGNIATQEQIVIVNDDIAPVPNVASLPEISAVCSVTISEAPVAIDNCADTISATTNFSLPFEYTTQGTGTIIWTYNDGNGNTITQEQTITLNDDIAPVPDIANLDISGACSVTISEAPTASDNCADSITATTNDPLEYFNQGTYTIIWTYNDGNGNSSTQEQTIIVNDDVNPVIACKTNQSRDILAAESVYIVLENEFDPTSTSDNCGIAEVLNDFNNTATLNGAKLPAGTTTVTWTVTGATGNTAQCNFDVMVSKSTGLSNLDKTGISVYPNPVDKILNLTSGEDNIQRIIIFNIIGKPIFEKIVVNSVEHIDMSSFSAGVYFISIYTDKDVFTGKIIKK